MSFTAQLIIILLLAAVGSYLFGSVSFAIIFTKAFKNTDVREHGSGNAGMTNAFRAGGKISGILTMVCDLGKAVLCVSVGRFLVLPFLQTLAPTEAIANSLDPVYGAFICGFFCFLGHLYPVYYGFRGGKGVLVTAGTALVIDWRVFLCAIGTFLIVLLISRIVSLSSVCAAIAYPVFTFIFSDTPDLTAHQIFFIDQRLFKTLVAALMGIILIIKHWENIKRLVKGQEKKISFKKKQA